MSDRSPTPSAVVFDLGGVLIDWDPRYLYRSLFDDEDAMERFLAEVTTAEWNGRQDAGRPFAEAVASLSQQYPEHEELIGAFWSRWTEMLGEAIGPTVEILAELRETGVGLYALSNWSAETFPLARPRFPFLDWFDGIVISGEVRVAKPDERIFMHLLDHHGLAASETVFIDDSEANAAAAASLGLIAIHFEGAGPLRRELETLGLLPAASQRERAS
ncbi:MAG: HAD family hydrolase [Chloroflexota bacterium]